MDATTEARPKNSTDQPATSPVDLPAAAATDADAAAAPPCEVSPPGYCYHYDDQTPTRCGTMRAPVCPNLTAKLCARPPPTHH